MVVYTVYFKDEGIKKSLSNLIVKNLNYEPEYTREDIEKRIHVEDGGWLISNDYIDIAYQVLQKFPKAEDIVILEREIKESQSNESGGAGLLLIIGFILAVLLAPLFVILGTHGKFLLKGLYKKVLDNPKFKKFRLPYNIAGLAFSVACIAAFVVGIILKIQLLIMIPLFALFFGNIVYIVLGMVIANQIYKKQEAEKKEEVPSEAEQVNEEPSEEESSVELATSEDLEESDDVEADSVAPIVSEETEVEEVPEEENENEPESEIIAVSRKETKVGGKEYTINAFATIIPVLFAGLLAIFATLYLGFPHIGSLGTLLVIALLVANLVLAFTKRKLYLVRMIISWVNLAFTAVLYFYMLSLPYCSSQYRLESNTHYLAYYLIATFGLEILVYLILYSIYLTIKMVRDYKK